MQAQPTAAEISHPTSAKITTQLRDIQKQLPLRVLSEDDWQHWITKGYVIVRNAVPVEKANRLADLLWEFDEKDPNDSKNDNKKNEKQDKNETPKDNKQDKHSDEKSKNEPIQPPLDKEKTQALNQWLRQIQDDPGLLLQRKLWYLHQEKRNENRFSQEDGQNPW